MGAINGGVTDGSKTRTEVAEEEERGAMEMGSKDFSFWCML